MQDDIKPPVNRQLDEPAADQFSPTPNGPGIVQSDYHLPPSKKSKKKVLLIVLLVLLLLGGGAAAYWYWFMREEPATQTPHNQEMAEQPLTTTSGKFYISKTHEEITVYDPVAKTTSSVKFPLGKDRTVFVGEGGGSNQFVQFSADGKKILVANYNYEMPESGPGEEITERQISIFENGKETELTPLNNDQGVYPEDALLSPDGKTVYLLLGSSQKNDPLELHSVDVATKKMTMLGENLTGMHDDRTPMRLDEAGTLSFYTNVNKVVTHHMVKDGKYTSAKVATLTCECGFEFPQPVSPDGKSIILEELKDGEKGDFTYFLLNMADGKTAQIANPAKPTEQFTSWQWTPDSRHVAFDTAGFGGDAHEFDPRIEVMDIASKQTTKVTDGSAEDSPYILSWSPDGRLLAFVDEEKVKFYDMTNKKIVETGISLKGIDSETVFGWLK